MRGQRNSIHNEWAKMSEAEYRAHPAISRSELWHILDSPQKFRYIKDHPSPPTPSLLLGQVFHKLVLEAASFADDCAVAPICDRRTKEGKLQWDEFQEDAAGKVIIAPEMYKQAAAMRASVEAEPLAVKLLSGLKEVPLFWRDDVTGEECKCRADCLNCNHSQPIVVDLKSTTDASTEAFTNDAIKLGYDLQAAMYSAGVEANIMERPLFVFIVVEKTPPYAVNILQADKPLLRRGRRLYRDAMDTYHGCKLTGNWYGYLGKNRQINNLALPYWAARREE